MTKEKSLNLTSLIVTTFSAVCISVILEASTFQETLALNDDLTPTAWQIFLPLVDHNFGVNSTPAPTSIPESTFIPTSTSTPTGTVTSTNTATATPSTTPTSTITSTPTVTPTATATPCGSLSGIISSDTILPEDCTYLVTDNVLVQSGITLTVGAGNHLIFSGEYYLRVDGVLIAVGTESRRIIFTSKSQSPGSWIGIALIGTTGSTISFATIEYGGGATSVNPGALNLKNGFHLIDNVVFQNNRKPALDSGSGNIVIQNSTIINNNDRENWAVKVSPDSLGTTQFLSNTFSQNDGTGIILIQGDGPVLVQENKFLNNATPGTGIIFTEGAGNVEILNNTFISNTLSAGSEGGLIFLDSVDSATISCNLLANNRAIGGMDGPNALIRARYGRLYTEINNNSIIPGEQFYTIVTTLVKQPTVDARDNYWGTTDQAEISNSIYDFFDDFNLAEVMFSPYLSAPPPCAPSIESRN